MDTGQRRCFSDTAQLLAPPKPGERFYGQDAFYQGAQRSDLKSGEPNDPLWAQGHGPQGDEVRIRNFARAVRSVQPGTIKLVQPDLTPLTIPPLPGKGPGGPGPGPGFPPPKRPR